MPRAALLRILLIGSIGTLATSCGSSAERAPNVVLIVLDTVRADHVSCYGYARPTTPHVDALAQQADRHTLARSTAPWTLPSHASLFTGLFPHAHGVDARKIGEHIEDGIPLDSSRITLAEALSAEGYATAAFVANKGYVTERYGFSQGFESFVSERKPGREMSASAAHWLDARDESRPFFLFLNLMDAHRPYNVAPLPEPQASALPAPPSESPAALLEQLYTEVYAQDDPPTPELVQRVVDAYDLGIANADAGVGALLDELKRRGLFEDALIVVTADHGEFLGEHDLVEHSKDVYEPALRVPLVVKRPGQREARLVDAAISLADVPGLVVAALPRDAQQRNAGLFPGSSPERGSFAELKYSRKRDLESPWGARFMRERVALFEGRFKLIRSSDGRHELYDLAADPHEAHNLFTERGEHAAKLMRRLESLQRAGASEIQGGAPRPLTADELRELRELGYAGDEE